MFERIVDWMGGSPLEGRLAGPLRAEQVRLLYTSGYAVLAGVFGVAVLMVASLWAVVDTALLGGWLAVFALLLGVRAWMLRRVLARGIRVGNAPRLRRLYALGTGLSGVLWGAGNWLFFTPEVPLVVAVLVTFTLGISAGAATSTALYYPAYFSFLLPAVTPIAVLLGMQGGILLPLGIAVGLYVVGSTFFARYFHRASNDSLRLRFENLELVAEARREQARAEVARREAEAANVAKSRFLAATSHDLRQPLHALGLFVDTLEATPERAARMRILKRIRESVTALENLFNALLDISKLDAGIVPVRREHFQVGQLCRRLGNEFQPLARARGVRLRLGRPDPWVESDPVLLERILRNVMTNALRYSDRGTVLVGARRDGGGIRLEVWDQGCGIPGPELDSVFSEFHQLSNPERDRTKGLGLGLAIVRRLCQLLGHRYELVSELGRGSGFRLWLPAGDAARAEGPAPDGPAPGRPAAGQLILVIDDEAAILESTCLLLESWGYEVVLADGVEAAQARLAGRRPALVITDFRLRGRENGIEAMQRLEGQLDTRLDALVITGDSSPAILKAASAGGYPLLHKPVRPTQLRMAINRTLGAARRRGA